MCLMRDDMQTASTANVIRFGSLREDYGFFSNFAPTPIVLRGKTWSTVEHFFQAQKFVDTRMWRRFAWRTLLRSPRAWAARASAPCDRIGNR
jgi:predicted NAD-dependent protein-ADP-ribosyltransferase YbiA (DUF1768 family)